MDWPGVAGTYAFGRPAWDADDDNRKQEYSESGWGAWSILKSGAHGRWPVTSSSDPFPQPTLIGNAAQTSTIPSFFGLDINVLWRDRGIDYHIIIEPKAWAIALLQ